MVLAELEIWTGHAGSHRLHVGLQTTVAAKLGNAPGIKRKGPGQWLPEPNSELDHTGIEWMDVLEVVANRAHTTDRYCAKHAQALADLNQKIDMLANRVAAQEPRVDEPSKPSKQRQAAIVESGHQH